MHLPERGHIDNDDDSALNGLHYLLNTIQIFGPKTSRRISSTGKQADIQFNIKGLPVSDHLFPFPGIINSHPGLSRLLL